MATQSKATGKAAQAQVRYTCSACGKKLTRNASQTAGVGHKCATIAAQYTPAQLQAHYASITGAVPQGYITVATLDKAIKANKAKYPGLTISKMVKAIGGDRALNAPAHPICKPIYNGQRYVHGWLATPQGLQAIATGNYAGAPAPATK